MPRVKEKLESAAKKTLKAAEAKGKEIAEKAADSAAAAEIEVKKSARSAGRKAKAKSEAVNAEVAEKVADAAAAVEIEAKKTARAAGRKARAKTEAVNAEVAESVADAAAAVEIEAKKTAAKVRRNAKAGIEKAEESAKATGRKARAAKLGIVIQSAMGGAITTEEIAAKLPKDSVSAYVKVEENKIYWVAKDGETGSVDIW